MKKTCLVTGASGFLGTELVSRLASNGWRVLAYSRTRAVGGPKGVVPVVGDVSSLDRVLEKDFPDTLFHCAASTFRGEGEEEVTALLRANVEFGAQLLEKVRRWGEVHVVYAGSYWQRVSATRPWAANFYAATKNAFAEILRYYVAAHRFSATEVRLYDLYGPGDTRPKIANLLVDAIRTGRGMDASDGRRRLDLVHVSDACAGLEIAANRRKPGRYETFGLGSGREVSVKELCRRLEGLAGRKAPVRWGALEDPSSAVPVPDRGLPKLPRFKPRIALDDGLRELLSR